MLSIAFVLVVVHPFRYDMKCYFLREQYNLKFFIYVILLYILLFILFLCFNVKRNKCLLISLAYLLNSYNQLLI